jgi:hypothetical protein
MAAAILIVVFREFSQSLLTNVAILPGNKQSTVRMYQTSHSSMVTGYKGNDRNRQRAKFTDVCN